MKKDLLKLVEKKNIEKMGTNALPNFKAGDTIVVHTRVVEGKAERIQKFEGVCIARKNDGINSSFTVRKISFGEGVEKLFPVYSPTVAKVEVVKYGRVRRAKLYFLRALFGKKARISEDLAQAAKARKEAKESAEG